MWSWQPKKWPRRSKNEEKWPYYGYFWAIGITLWRRDSYNMNIYWHPWFGPILSTFGCLEVSFAGNSSLVWLGVSEVPAPLRWLLWTNLEWHGRISCKVIFLQDNPRSMGQFQWRPFCQNYWQFYQCCAIALRCSKKNSFQNKNKRKQPRIASKRIF